MLDPQGRIVVVNQAWVRFAAEGQAALADQPQAALTYG